MFATGLLATARGLRCTGGFATADRVTVFRTGVFDAAVLVAVLVATVRLRVVVDVVVKMYSLKNRCAIMAQRGFIIHEMIVKSIK